MSRYVPLTKEGDRLVPRVSQISDLFWTDTAFMTAFTQELHRRAKRIHAKVHLSGAEFGDRVVYHIAEGDEYYILVDERDVPLEIWQGDHEEIEARLVARQNIRPDPQATENLLNQVSNSDVFYENLMTALSVNYVLPHCNVDDVDVELFHSIEILSYPYILLMGPPGAGKTSLVRRLAYDCAVGNRQKIDRYPVPVYISLRNYHSKLRTLSDAISNQEESFGHEYMAPKRFEGNVLYIFDGFDELDLEVRQNFRRWLVQFKASKPSLRIIITSREFDVSGTPEFSGFKTINILPFGRPQQVEYCRNFFEDDESAGRFLAVLEQNPAVERFLTNPLGLSLSLALYAVRGLLPFNVGELVQEIVNQLTEGWDLRRGIKRYRNLNAALVKFIFGHIATKMHLSNLRSFSPQDILDALPIELSSIDVNDILEELRETTGLISKSQNNWAFVHQYFQDFFCALYLRDRIRSIDEEIREYATEPRWNGVWEQIANLCADPEQFVEQLASRTMSGPDGLRWVSTSLLSAKGLTVAGELQLEKQLNREVKRLVDQVDLQYDDDGVKLSITNHEATKRIDLLNLILTLRNVHFAERDDRIVKLIQDRFVREFLTKLAGLFASGRKTLENSGANDVAIRS